MRRSGVALVGFLVLALILGAGPAGAEYVLKDMGSFHVGGRQVSLKDLPIREIVFSPGSPPTKVDPNGDFEVEQMYVQYFIPADQKSKHPLLMWHGGGLTGETWETKPDGQPGWKHYFLKAGHAVYVSDAVERGRSSWARFPEIFKGEPLFRTKKEAWEFFRIGAKDSYKTDPKGRVAYPGVLFPTAAFDQFCKQSVPRWATTDPQIQAAYNALVAKVGECVLMPHSQGGNFAFQAALAAPDKVKAIIAIEPSGAPAPGPALDKIKHIPMLIIWGDYIDRPDLALAWPKFQAGPKAMADDLKAKGGQVDWVELPKAGIKGNDHMLMMDTNSDQIAALIQDWLVKHKLMK